VKSDLKLIGLRSVLDPKRFYKKEKFRFPKHFQIGTVINDHSEYYSSRIPKRERKEHFVQEIIDNQEQKSYLKRKFSTIQKGKTPFINKKWQFKGNNNKRRRQY